MSLTALHLRHSSLYLRSPSLAGSAPIRQQGSKVCAKFPDGMIFGEKNLDRAEWRSGRPARSRACFFFAGPVVGWPVKIFFRMARQPEGRACFFFAAGSPAGVFSYRESLIGRARPARCRPNFKPAGLEIWRSAKKNLDRAESSQSQRLGCRACFFSAGLPNFRTAGLEIRPAK